jgi:SAM-dependent methyltransferase
MTAGSPEAGWFEEFFTGAALDLWRKAISQETTDQEIEFLQEVLAAPEGGHLIDLPCGNGRLSLPFSQLGYKVSGVDFSAAFIEEAKTNAAAKKLKIDYIKDDMRKVSFKNKFDGAFCMGNSFGYFDRAGTSEFFKTVSGCLKSGAKFVIESGMIAECFLVNGGQREWVQVGDMTMLIENNYNCRFSCVETNYTFIRDGKEEKRRAVHWIYTAGEICRMLEQADFAVDDLFSSTDFDQFALGAERLLVVAQRR